MKGKSTFLKNLSKEQLLKRSKDRRKELVAKRKAKRLKQHTSITDISSGKYDKVEEITTKLKNVKQISKLKVVLSVQNY